MDYFKLELQINSPNYPQIQFKENQLLLGFVTQGWAKIQLTKETIEKIEHGRWFLCSLEQLIVDRTSEENVQITFIACSQDFIQSLFDLGLDNPSSKTPLQEFVTNGHVREFQSAPMNAAAHALANEISGSPHKGFKQRLTLEANTLSWIAEVLNQSQFVDSEQAVNINAHDRDAIEAIASQMRSAPGHEYSLAELCTLGGINEHKLKRTFKQIYQVTVFTYLRDIRMDYAAELLKENRMNVLQVANEVGYSNASHFARAFKDRHGLLPKAYQCIQR